MSKHQCVICKHLFQLPETVPVFDAFVYREEGRSHKIKLCLLHDIELFKIGQYRFVDKYSYLAYNVVGSDEHDFLNLLKMLGPSRKKPSRFY
ncbi:MAG: hypothetical protein JNM93_02975 [Bacteriovoracaceae bacterium]|nr:hypothetical protein [Bacteriovoracaceae bacterium]